MPAQAPAPLARHVKTISGLQPHTAALYDGTPVDGYVLKPYAQHLAKLRKAMADDPVFRGFARSKNPPVIQLGDWTALLGAATPAERKLLLGGVYKVSR